MQTAKILCELRMANSNPGDYLLIWTCQKKVALRNIAKMEKSQFFVLFENEASYEDLFCPQVFYVMLWILCVTFSIKI